MQLGLIGAGNMARALARGWGEPIFCSDGGSGRARELVAELGGKALSNREVAERADVVVLCHKPYQRDPVAREIEGLPRIVASVVGGTTPHELRALYEPAATFVFMPNTAVEVKRGTVLYAEPSAAADSAAGSDEPVVDREVESQVLELFGRLGNVVRLPEALIPAATAISGVGPAYQALLAEAQVDAAVRRGLTPQLAGQLVVETMAGSAALLAQRGYDTLRVRREVTSPGGLTARGLEALERGGIRSAFQAAIDAVIGPPREGLR